MFALAPLYLATAAALRFLTRRLDPNVSFGKLIARLVVGSVFGALAGSLVPSFARAEQDLLLMSSAAFGLVTAAVATYLAKRMVSDDPDVRPDDLAARTFVTTAILMASGAYVYGRVAWFVGVEMIGHIMPGMSAGQWIAYGVGGVAAVVELLDSIPTF